MAAVSRLWTPAGLAGYPRAMDAGAPGRRARLGLRRLRCRPRHTVATAFPGWIVPNEKSLLDGLAMLVVAAGQGASWRMVATTVGVGWSG